MKVLFLISGLGLGNSTRCHSIIQRLAKKDAKISIITSGNGVWYFGDRPGVDEVIEIESLYYGAKDGRISILRTAMAVPALLGILRRNAAKIANVIEKMQPDIAITDSVYTVRPFKRAGIPVVALNNADVVKASFKFFTDKPSSIQAQYYGVELMDFYFHKRMVDLVISPTLFTDIQEFGGNVVRIGPIVRENYEPQQSLGPVSNVLIMLSGSTFGSAVPLNRVRYPFEVHVVGRDAPDDDLAREGIFYHGKVIDNRKLVSDADLVIVNGGFSAVSEMFSMRKPVLVVPVPNHAEQWVNARTIQHLGVGKIVAEQDIETAMLDAVDKIDEYRSAYELIPKIPDGAQEAADAIVSVINSR